MKAEALRLCYLMALLFGVLCCASLQALGGGKINFWLGLLLANGLFEASLASLILSLWVHWCCPPDPTETGTGLCPE